MHKCAKCGRAATSLEEIGAGCPCGSKVFKFDKQAVASDSAQEGNGKEIGKAENEGAGSPANGARGGADGAPGDGNGAREGSDGATGWNGAPGNGSGAGGNGAQEGKVPESYFARSTFTSEDIENIKVLTQGVFLLDVRAIAKDPVVLKDEDEIYYVKLPLEQKGQQAAPSQEQGGNGKK